MRDLLDLGAGLFAIRAGLQRDFEILALPDCCDRGVAQARQGAADGLPLRIQDRWFHGDVDACFHEDSIVTGGEC